VEPNRQGQIGSNVMFTGRPLKETMASSFQECIQLCVQNVACKWAEFAAKRSEYNNKSEARNNKL
jgi:hypothetical protein